MRVSTSLRDIVFESAFYADKASSSTYTAMAISLRPDADVPATMSYMSSRSFVPYSLLRIIVEAFPSLDTQEAGVHHAT